MLIEFSFENFRSFREENTLYMEATSDSEHENCLIDFRGEKHLPVAAIYGANGSGKTTVNQAMAFAINLICSSGTSQVDSEIPVTPFLLDEDSRNNPSKFEFIFTTGEKKYRYGFSVNRYEVLEEYLFEYKSSKPSKIFEREPGNRFSFTSILRPKLEPMVDRTSKSRLFLATASAWDSPYTKEAYIWFLNQIHICNPNMSYSSLYQYLDSRSRGTENKDKLLHLMKNSDLQICDFVFESKPGNFNALTYLSGSEVSSVVRESDSMNSMEHSLLTYHKTKDGTVYPFPLKFESSGTKFFLKISPFILEALETGGTLVIDELDASLHPELVSYIIDLFQNKWTNKHQAQLIFNSQDTTQLDLDKFRRDQIYFAQKSDRTGESSLFSLDEFSVRKTEDIEKAYRLGRYGAIPMIRDGIQ